MEGNSIDVIRPPTRDRRITCWLGAYPWKEADPDILVALVNEILQFCNSYGGVGSIWTSEPRTYRPTVHGLACLQDTIGLRRADTLTISTPPQFNRGGFVPVQPFTATVNFFDEDFPMTNASIEVTVQAPLEASLSSVVMQLVDFVARWFEPLQALSAFVSSDVWGNGTIVGDSPEQTAMERERQVTPLEAFPLLEVYARGVFWGNGLGPSLCARMGGVERVLAEAPVLVARPMGSGVWLQLSGTPPPDQSELDQLASYFRPLTEWTWESTQAVIQAYLAANRPTEAVPPVSPVRLPSIAAKATSRKKAAVPVRWLPDAHEDAAVGLNVHLAAPPSAAQRAQLEGLIAAWYRCGFEGLFGGVGFHTIWGPSVDGSVLRWYVDLGSADPRRAIQGLVEKLEASTLSVAHVIVGTETAG